MRIVLWAMGGAATAGIAWVGGIIALLALPAFLLLGWMNDKIDRLDGTADLRDKRLALVVPAEKLPVTNVRKLVGGSWNDEFIGISVTVSNPTQITIINPTLFCNVDQAFIPFVPEDPSTRPNLIGLSLDTQRVRLAPGESMTFEVPRKGYPHKAATISNLRCKVLNYDASDAYRRASR